MKKEQQVIEQMEALDEFSTEELASHEEYVPKTMDLRKDYNTLAAKWKRESENKKVEFGFFAVSPRLNSGAISTSVQTLTLYTEAKFCDSYDELENQMADALGRGKHPYWVYARKSSLKAAKIDVLKKILIKSRLQEGSREHSKACMKDLSAMYEVFSPVGNYEQ